MLCTARSLRRVCKYYRHNATLLNAIGSSDMAHNANGQSYVPIRHGNKTCVYNERNSRAGY
eukprot:3905021-Amphidinium_carterae.1